MVTMARWTVVGWVMLAGAMTGVLGAGISRANEPPIEVVQRPSHSPGDLEYRVGVSYGSSGQSQRMSFGGVEAEAVHVQARTGLSVALTYRTAERVAVWSGWEHTSFRDATRLSGSGVSEEMKTRRQRGVLLAGARYRLAPNNSLDPTVSVGFAQAEGMYAEVSVARIADPTVASLAVRRFTSMGPMGQDATEGTDAFGVHAMVGLVANDHVTLKVAVGHRTPLKRIEPPTSTLSVTWSWQVDAQRRQSVDVSAGVRRTGQHSELVFGVELGGRWADRR